MENDQDTVMAFIDPRVVRWYLKREIAELNDLRPELRAPSSFKTISDINAYDASRKARVSRLKKKLEIYDKYLDLGSPLSIANTKKYFTKQLRALDAKEIIDMVVVDMAYDAYKIASNKKGYKGEPVFRIVNDESLEPRIDETCTANTFKSIATLSIFAEPWQDIQLSEAEICSDEPLEESRLYRYLQTS